MGTTSNANFTFRRNTNLIAANSATGKFFTFAAKSSPWPNDVSPPDVQNSVSELEYKIHNEMIFGKFVPDSNLSLMSNRYDWTSGTVYDMYDDTDAFLFQKKFFVLTLEAGAYHVFKCLSNNGGAPSTSQPLLAETAANDAYYSTADGYQWKYLYSFDTATYARFATTNYIPVVSNTSVVGNAVSGAIETYSIQSPGGNYNSYTNGYFTDIAVGGNTQFFSIQGSDTTILSVSANTYTVGETVRQIYSGSNANGVVSSQSGNVLTLKNVNGIFTIGANTITGLSSGKVSTVLDVSSPQVSSNNDFYTGCSIYISSGTGAGQVGSIIQYFVVGNARRILLANSFAILPDLTSKYIISPRVVINGDGTGAQALSVINPTTNQLQSIQVISRGSGYNYANVSILGNTGSTSVASNNAVVRAILPPRGGHGSNNYAELNAVYYQFSTTFSNTESGKIPGTGSQYRRVGIISDPKFANVNLAYSYSSSPNFTAAAAGNAVVRGSISNAYGYISSPAPAANTVRLTNVSGIFQSSDVLTATYANGGVAIPSSSNVVVQTVTGQGSVFDNRTLLICQASTLSGGTFANNEKIVQTTAGIDYAYGTIQSIVTSGANTYIYLTEVKGNFQSSDIGSGTYKYINDDATRQKQIQVNDIVASDLVPYTGNILYTENIQPVTRNAAQSETVKLTVGFN
jgi:hypothetical protein